MQTVVHILSILLLWAVFQLGSMIAQRSEEWSLSLAMGGGDYQVLRKSFLVGGKIIQLAALVWVVMNLRAIVPMLQHIHL
jgi:hypothetical protein